MLTASNQLTDIFRQLTEKFSSHTAISIVPIHGDPPDRYEASYAIPGLSKLENGDILESTDHKVEISIPFGFPHFPPSCKPKSDIFHPDFDPAAICLGDFWHQDRQLSDLIIYIGQMINGERYSRTDCFNEEASSWYEHHQDRFPLTKIKWQSENLNDFQSDTEQSMIDTLNESDLTTDFDFLAIEETRDEDKEQEASMPAVHPSSTFDPQFLDLLERQKKYFTLREHLHNGGDEKLPDELEKLLLKAEEITGQSEGLYRDARRCEKRGDALGAIQALERIGEYTEDFPDLESHLDRVRQSLVSLESGTEPEPGLRGDTDRPTPAPQVERKMPRSLRKMPAPRRRWSGKRTGFLLGGIAGILIASCGYVYWSSQANIATAETSFSLCTTLMENGHFQEAQGACKAAESACNKYDFFTAKKAGRLKAQIIEVMQSERMIQGLKGMILIDGRYMAQKEAELLKSSRRLREEADELYQKESWQSAVERYSKVLSIAETPGLIPLDVIEEVRNKHEIALFRQAYDPALQFLDQGKWQQAVAQLKKAEKLLGSLPQKELHEYTARLKQSVARGTFEQAREQGDLFFSRSEWQGAMASYEQALSTPIRDTITQETIDEINLNLKRAELYNLIDQGIKAFGAGAWDEAIGDYRRAEEFLANHQNLLDVPDAEKSIKKLSRIILRALIVRDRQLAAVHLEKNELPAANDVYRHIIDRMNHTPFAEENEFKSIRVETLATIQDLDEKIFIAEKSSYLEETYQSLFASTYPAAVANNLINPVVSFAKNIDGRAVFKMQCTETGGGRPLTLVMYYAFNRNTERWEAYSEQQ